MKIRTDFVTNSSSSSFVTIKKLAFPIESKGGKKTECVFTSTQKDKKTNDNVNNKEFKSFVNEYHLLTGSKPTVSKMIRSKKLQSEFGNYLEKERGGKVRLDEMLLEESAYRIGFGESMGDDFENEARYLTSHFHPNLRDLLEKHSILSEYNGVRFLHLIIKYNKLTSGSTTDSFYYIDIHPNYCNEYKTLAYPYGIEFYHCIDAEFQYPNLSPEAMQKELRALGFTVQMIDALEAEGIRIIYADFGSGKNDVFAYSYNESYTVVLTRHVLENFDTQMIKNMEYPQITAVAE